MPLRRPRDTDFTVTLVDVYPNGVAIPITEGILRARYRHGYEKMDFVQPGEPDKYCIRVYPTSNVFKAGHRIRVRISSSNFPHFSRNLNTGEDVATGTRMQIAHQTILHSSQYPSHIVLPIVPHRKGFKDIGSPRRHDPAQCAGQADTKDTKPSFLIT